MAMLRLFHSVTKGRPCGVHQCSCSNQVLLCTPLRQGAWKEWQEGLPHLRKEERAEWHVTPGCSGQNEVWIWVCTMHFAQVRQASPPAQGWAFSSCHQIPVPSAEGPGLHARTPKGYRYSKSSSRRHPVGPPWGSRPFYQSLC